MAENLNSLDETKANTKRAAKQAEEIAEKTMDQTRGAFDNYFNFLQKTFSAYPLGGSELTEKVKTYTEKNIATAREFIHKLGQAKDLQDVFRIQTEFMQVQLHAFAQQSKELTEAFTKGVMGSVKTPFSH